MDRGLIMGLFDDIIGSLDKKPSEPLPDPKIAFDVWAEKQPFFQKIPKEDSATIQVTVANFKKIAAAAYAAGFHRRGDAQWQRGDSDPDECTASCAGMTAKAQK